MPTVAVVIIGDEILSGKFADQNGPFLIGQLRALGADLRRLVVIPDVVEVIADEVRRCADACDQVITTGGVGPTHDDVTMMGVAAAFSLQLHPHPELVRLLAEWGMSAQTPELDAAMRMALVPEGTTLLHTQSARFPAARVRNVTVLPGVPSLVRAKFPELSGVFAGVPVHTARLYTRQRETEIAAALSSVQDQSPAVAIGSYPRYEETRFRVVVTLESRDAAALQVAVDALSARIALADIG